MTHGHLHALIPLRELARGKERLAAVLDAAARRALIEAMACDVIEALRDAGFAPERIVLVSEDAEVAALARRLGVALFQPAPARDDPLNAALAEATRHARGEGADTVLILHADLPCVAASALQELCAAHAARAREPRVTLVADRAGTGTNCLVLTPPDAIALGFGADSRARHRAAAAAVHYTEFTAPGLAFDIDFAADLGALVRMGETPQNACGAHTRAWLATHGPR